MFIKYYRFENTQRFRIDGHIASDEAESACDLRFSNDFEEVLPRKQKRKRKIERWIWVSFRIRAARQK